MSDRNFSTLSLPLALLAALLTSAHAQAEVPTTLPAEAPPEEAVAPALWVVEGADRPSYLFGTVHVGVTAAQLPSYVHEALRASPVAVFEADVRLVNPFEMMQMAMNPPGVTLREHFDEEQWSRLRAAVGASIPAPMLEQYRPWFLYTVLLQSLVPPTDPMDLSLMVEAESNLAEVRFLETWQQQLGALAAVNEGAMVETVMEWVDDRAQLESEMDALIGAYRRGDTDAVTALVIEDDIYQRWPDLYERLIAERNRNWVPQLAPLLDEGGAFVAVGLGHLLGPDSVVSQLQASGYTIRPWSEYTSSP